MVHDIQYRFSSLSKIIQKNSFSKINGKVMEKSWRFTMWERFGCKTLLYFVTFVFERERLSLQYQQHDHRTVHILSWLHFQHISAHWTQLPLGLWTERRTAECYIFNLLLRCSSSSLWSHRASAFSFTHCLQCLTVILFH